MQRSLELCAVIAAWFDSVAYGDSSWVDRHVSRQAGVRLVGTDQDEELVGEAVLAFLREEVEAMGGVVQVWLSHVEAYQEGDVGWGLAHPTLTLPNGKQFSPRWSAVFHREDGAWKLVQLHASVRIPNEELLGMAITG